MSDEADKDDVAVRCGWTCPECGHLARWLSKFEPPSAPPAEEEIFIPAKHHKRASDGESCQYPGGVWQWQDGGGWVEPKFVPSKVGDIENVGGIDQMVMSVTVAADGKSCWTQCSAEPLATKRGYITQDECIGFKIEHDPPVFMPRGQPRTRLLEKDDWDFSALLKEKPEIKAVALFHELARESARVRLACRIFAKPPQCLIEEEDARKKEWDAAERGDRIESKRWRQSQTDLRMGADGWHERNEWESAKKFLDHLEARFPRGAKELLADYVASDTSWNSLTSEQREKMLRILDDAEKQRAEKQKRAPRKGLIMLDVRPEGVVWWPFDEALEFPREHDVKETPKYSYNRGIPGLPVLARLGNGSNAERIVTECFEIDGIKGVCDKIELCVRWNYRDDDIIEGFEGWLKSLREERNEKKPLLKLRERKARAAEFEKFIKAERAALPDGLAEFRESRKRTSVRLKSSDCDAGLKALAALRLVHSNGLAAAASMFQDIYKPSPKRTRGRKTDSVPTANVFTMAEKAVKRWQCEFFRYCPFDSEKRPQLKHGPWDHVCSLCMEHVYPIGHEPKKATAQWHEEDFRCPKCDHRETMQWNGASWFAVKWGAVEGSEHGEWKPVES